jgi:Family of unknown function (DUF5719)
MTKWIAAVLILGMTAVTLLLEPPSPPEPGLGAGVDLPPVTICPVSQGGGESTGIDVVSTVNGSGQVTVFSGGGPVGSEPYMTGASGSASIELVDIAAVGAATGLVELPNPDAAGSARIAGSASSGLEGCQTTPFEQTILAGGSTASGRTFQVQLMNPYAGEAVVDLVARSESGVESASELQDISVPARSAIVLEMSDMLPGRESLTMTVNATQGNVLTSGRLSNGGDLALWNSVAPAVDWFVPVPGADAADLVIATAASTDVDYQIDLYGPTGLVEGARSGQVPGRGEVAIDLASLEGSPTAIRVVAAQPVAVFLRCLADDALALTAGAAVPSQQWLLPGAGATREGRGELFILNPGLDDTTVLVTSRRGQSLAEQFVVPAGQVVAFDGFPGIGNGYSVRGDGDVVALWTTAGDAIRSYMLGVPILDE